VKIYKIFYFFNPVILASAHSWFIGSLPSLQILVFCLFSFWWPNYQDWGCCGRYGGMFLERHSLALKMRNELMLKYKTGFPL